MRAGLLTLALPWRALGKLRDKLNSVINSRRLLVHTQLATAAEVRELHQSGLLAAIRMIEEQRQARAELARDYARLEGRLEALERQLAALGAAGEPDRPAARD